MILSIGIADLWTPEDLLPGIICKLFNQIVLLKSKKLVRRSHIIVMDVQQMQPAQLLNQRTNFTAREIKKPEACRHTVALDTNPAQTLNQKIKPKTRIKKVYSKFVKRYIPSAHKIII